MALAGGEVTKLAPAFPEVAVAHLIQVGAGSGGMPVLDMLCRDPALTQVTLIEPDTYKPHNIVRHLFPGSAVGKSKAALARDWLQSRRPDLAVEVMAADILDPQIQERLDQAVAT